MNFKKRRFRIAAMLFAVCLFIPGMTMVLADQLAADYPDEEIHKPTPMPDRIFLGWEGDTATTQSVSWRTDESVISPQAQIALAEAGPDFPSKASTINADISEEVEVNHDYTNQIHSVNFEDLEPNMTYFYRVGDGVNWSEWLEFTTASDEDDPFSFIYMGDAQNDIHEHWSRVMRAAYSDLSDASFILHAGDMIDQGDADEQWGGWFKGAGWIYGMVPSIATIGNHEYSRITDTPSQLAENWETQFHYPDNGPEGLEAQVGYWDHQDMRIISLNSNTGHADIDQQAEWLDEVLENNSNQWTVVTFHHPIFSSGEGRDNARLRDALLPVIEKHNVDLVLQGHDHTYARGHMSNDQDGEKEYTTGTMFANSVAGPKMYNWSDANWKENGAYVRSGAGNTQMYQHIHVDGNELKYESYTALGELHDEFTMTKLDDGLKQITEGEGFEEPSEPAEPSIEQMQTQVEEFSADGNITNDETARHLQTQLTSVGHYEETGSMDKAVKHMNGFKTLLEQQKEDELISENAHDVLNAGADDLIELWGGEGNPTEVSVMSFNIQHGRGMDDIQDLNRTAQVIADSEADIVGLQEVDRHWSERSNFEDQAKWLAEKLDMHYVYGANLDEEPENEGDPNRQYGTAILSEYPIIESENHLLTQEGHNEQRGLLATTINVKGTHLEFYNTHIGLQQDERWLNVHEILDIMDQSANPSIIVGDFNALPEDPEIDAMADAYRDVFAELDMNEAYTYPAYYEDTETGEITEPNRRIDYIFADKHLNLLNGEVIPTSYSDHLPVTADFKLEKTPTNP